MQSRAFSKAVRHLQSAESYLEGMILSPNDLDKAADVWAWFLSDIEVAFNSLKKLAKGAPGGKDWIKRKEAERQEDELLRYVEEARHAHVHAAASLMAQRSGFLTIYKDGQWLRTLDVGFGGFEPDPEIGNIPGLTTTYVPPEIYLVPIANREGQVRPPANHLGKVLTNRTPYGIGKLALEYYWTAIKEAEQFLP